MGEKRSGMRSGQSSALIIGALSLLAAGLLAGMGRGAMQPARNTLATGIVFDDRNGNGQRDSGEPGLREVRVSNGSEVTKTDRSGRWRLPYDNDTPFFVIKPRGWRTPFDKNNLPRFYYLHKPAGSPPLKFAGVPPTGPLPASIDFPLRKQEEPDRFRTIFFADPQPRDQREIDYISHDVIEEVGGTDAKFGVTLGDILFDDLSLFDSLNGAVALIGIPWYNVIGNHDINQDARTEAHSDETYERYYGPSYYSFDYGPTHFVVLDDVNWIPAEQAGTNGRYDAGLGARQLEFLKNDLALVPRDQLVVLMMHIPLVEVKERQEVYRLIETRPYTMSIAGHTHYQEHRFLKKEDGWNGPKPHHHVVNVTVSGSWWSGAPDERGIPHTTMRCGAPNGYSIITFDGHEYSIEFRAASRPREYQMSIYAPEAIDSAKSGITDVLVNVFGSSERSKVEMRMDGDEQWSPMQKVVEPDPGYAALKALENSPTPPPGRKLPAIINSQHLWRAPLPPRISPGVRSIEVRTTDMFGQTYRASRVITVR